MVKIYVRDFMVFQVKKDGRRKNNDRGSSFLPSIKYIDMKHISLLIIIYPCFGFKGTRLNSGTGPAAVNGDRIS